MVQDEPPMVHLEPPIRLGSVFQVLDQSVANKIESHFDLPDDAHELDTRVSECQA